MYRNTHTNDHYISNFIHSVRLITFFFNFQSNMQKDGLNQFHNLRILQVVALDLKWIIKDSKLPIFRENQYDEHRLTSSNNAVHMSEPIFFKLALF